jgi:uncharacterized protein YgbK (DUF1537 family)
MNAVKGFRTKAKLTKRNKAILAASHKVLQVQRTEGRLVCQSLLLAVEEYFGAVLPQELVEMILADVQGLWEKGGEIAKTELQAIIVQTVQDFKAVVAEISADNNTGG